MLRSALVLIYDDFLTINKTNPPCLHKEDFTTICECVNRLHTKPIYRNLYYCIYNTPILLINQ